MPISSLTRVRAAAAAALLMFLALGSPIAFAQTPAADEIKLDPVLQLRAGQLTGRSRVIVEFVNAPDVRAITAYRGRAGRRLPGHRAQVAEIDNTALDALAKDPRVSRVVIDRPAYPTLFRTGAAVGATVARQRFGVTGEGIGVVIIDSGITPWHDDLYLADGV